MNQKTLAIAGAAAVVLLGAALYVSSRKSSDAAATATTGGRMFPELQKRLNDVLEVVVADADSTFAVKKDGATWGVADKGGYPVDFDKVKALVVGVSEFEYVAAMTKNPGFHAKLGVEEPSAPESTSKRVTLKDGSGAVLADVIVGKSKVNQGFGGKPSLYVRKVGEDQVHEVTGTLNVSGEISGWLDREVSKIESTRVKRAVVQHADGAVLSVSKAEPSQTNFTVENLPEGAELQWEGVANGISSALQYMSLDDVQRNEGFDLSGATVTEFACFDGLVVTARTIERDGKTWMTLAASVDESLRAGPAGPEAPPPAEGESEAAPATPPKPELKALDLVKQEVEELNAKWSPWVYAVPGYNAANLRKKLSDLLKQDAPADAEGGDAPIDLLGGETPPVPEDHSAHDHAPQPVTPPVDKPADAPVDKPADAPTDGDR